MGSLNLGSGLVSLLPRRRRPGFSFVSAIPLSFISNVLCLGIFMGTLMPAKVFAQTRATLQSLDLESEQPASLTVCTQNLKMYGKFADVRGKLGNLSAGEFREKEEAIARRILSAGCDVVAVQEVIASTDVKAAEVLKALAKVFKETTGRYFDTRVGVSNDEGMRNGFLVARDRASIDNVVSYQQVELPKLSADQKPRFFGRAPIEIQIQVKPQGETPRRVISLVNFHFKSRAGGAEDPTGLEWETYRMEMAEGLRRVIEERHKQSFQSGQIILMVLGDRNSDSDSATAKILDGTLKLSDFQTGGACRLSKRGVPLCKAGVSSQAILLSPLLLDPETSLLHGTFKQKKQLYWLDDILLPAAALAFAHGSLKDEGDYDTGVISEPAEASDHALAYVKMRW